MKTFLAAACLIAVIVASGCTNPFATGNRIQTDNLDVSIDVNNEVYQGQEFSAFLDVNNPGNLTYGNLDMQFFNTGSFEKIGNCQSTPKTLGPNGMATLECRLRYPTSRILESPVTEQIDASVGYEKVFNYVLNFPIISTNEQEKEQVTHTLQQLPTSYAEFNNELLVESDITENPVVLAGGDKYVYFTIKNVGNGFINDIRGEDITISSVPSGFIERSDCNIPVELFQDRGTFTKISCKLYTYGLGDYTNAFVFLTFKYNYELRQSSSITVKR